LLDDVVVSVDAVLFVVVDDDWSLLIVPLALPPVVPLAPMLDVPVELLGEVELLYELLGVVLLDVLPAVPWSGVLLVVDEALVPPAAEPEPDEPVCAMAKPPMASAAAAANVVSVFLVVVMSSAP
jgi:hypothetical protein